MRERWWLRLLAIFGCAALLGLTAKVPAATAAEDPSYTARLLHDLNDPSPRVRLNGVISANNAGEQARGTTPRLLEMLAREPDEEVRRYVARALAQTSNGVPGVASALARALREDVSLPVRRAAAESLGQLGVEPETAVPALGAALADADADLRREATKALGAFKGGAAEAVPLLEKAVANTELAHFAVGSLGKLGPAAAPAVPVLRRLAVTPAKDVELRRRAVWALGAIGEPAAVAAPDCLALLSGTEPELRLEAAIALLTWRHETATAVRVLNQSLAFTTDDASTEGGYVRFHVVARAAWAAGEYAAMADGDTLARLAVASLDRDRDIRRPAAESFRKVRTALVEQRRFDALDSMISAREFLAASSDEALRQRSLEVGDAVAELERLQPPSVWIHRHAGRLAAAAVAVLAVLGWLVWRLRRRAPRVFLSYRRGDSAAWCGRLHDALETQLGAGSSFRDVDSLEAGARFDSALRERIAACDAFVVVIGPGWLAAADAQGRCRIEQPDDVVRREIELALAAGKPLFPVLVDGARMPAVAELPPSIAALASAQATTLTDAHFRAEVAQLVKAFRGRSASGA
jgi:HEAT repeat protein